MSPGYAELFPLVLQREMWERHAGAATEPLARLLCAYIKVDHALVASRLLDVLGVWQKLVSSRRNEVASFLLLEQLVKHIPPGERALACASVRCVPLIC